MEHEKRVSGQAWCLATAVLTALLFVLGHLRGIGLPADAWAYWQGAVNIAEGNGYRYFSGNPIIAWPPLYSIYLAAWTKLLGQTTAVLVAANTLLLLVQAYGWCWLYLLLTKDSRTPAPLMERVQVSLFIAFAIVLFQASAMAQNLTGTFLPFFLGALWLSHRREGRASWPSLAVAIPIGTAMLLSHNSSIVMVSAAACTLFFLGRGKLVDRFAGGALLVGVPLLAWVVCRAWLGQGGSHPFVGGQFSVPMTVYQAGEAIGRVLTAPQIAYPALLVLFYIGFCILRERKRDSLLFAAVFCGVALALLICLFSSVWLNGSIGETRHILFIPLLIVPLMMHFTALSQKRLFAVLIILTLPVSVSRYVKWNFLDKDDLVPLSATISRTTPPGTVQVVDGLLLAGPKAWEEPAGGYSKDGVPLWGPHQQHIGSQ
jgi:hypothetical protein